jgi:hypothetical protein
MAVRQTVRLALVTRLPLLPLRSAISEAPSRTATFFTNSSNHPLRTPTSTSPAPAPPLPPKPSPQTHFPTAPVGPPPLPLPSSARILPLPIPRCSEAILLPPAPAAPPGGKSFPHIPLVTRYRLPPLPPEIRPYRLRILPFPGHIAHQGRMTRPGIFCQPPQVLHRPGPDSNGYILSTQADTGPPRKQSIYTDSEKGILCPCVTLQSRVAPKKICCGPGVRAGRAGSTGRDRERLGETTDSPQGEAGGHGPRPLHEEITAL